MIYIMQIIPKDMFQAVEYFWGVKEGRWENVTASERNEVAQNFQIILSSDKRTPNVTVFDNGEGQNPADFPDTFLSIAHGNKNDIPFVQGKYNFGATGAVVFCGETHRYQMIISRRSSELNASRDRLKKGKYYNELREDIISLLKRDPDISQKDQEYKGKTFKESKQDKDLIESFFSRFKSNPDVRKILSGNNGSFSFYNKKASSERKQSNDRNNSKRKAEKNLQRYPSIFKVKGFDTDFREYVKAIKKGGRGDHTVLPNENAQKLKVQMAGPYDGEIRVIIAPKEYAEVGERIPLSIKMISSVGEYEVVHFVYIK